MKESLVGVLILIFSPAALAQNDSSSWLNNGLEIRLGMTKEQVKDALGDDYVYKEWNNPYDAWMITEVKPFRGLGHIEFTPKGRVWGITKDSEDASKDSREGFS